MTVVLDREGLMCLVKGSSPDYSVFSHPLLIAAGHSYSDQYGRMDWHGLDKLTDSQLWELYLICRKRKK